MQASSARKVHYVASKHRKNNRRCNGSQSRKRSVAGGIIHMNDVRADSACQSPESAHVEQIAEWSGKGQSLHSRGFRYGLAQFVLGCEMNCVATCGDRSHPPEGVNRASGSQIENPHTG